MERLLLILCTAGALVACTTGSGAPADDTPEAPGPQTTDRRQDHPQRHSEDQSAAAHASGGSISEGDLKSAVLVRPCEDVESRVAEQNFEKLKLGDGARPLRVGPPSQHLGFAPGTSTVVYVHPHPGAVWAVPADGGSPRRISEEGHDAKYWFPDPDGEDVIYDAGTTYRAKLGEDGVKPAPQVQTPIERLKADMSTLADAGHPRVHPTRISSRWLVGQAAPNPVVLDRETGTVHRSAPIDISSVWHPVPMPEANAFAFVGRDEHVYVSYAESREVRCVSGPVNQDVRLNSFMAATEDGHHLTYMRYREKEKRVRDYELHLVDVLAGEDRILGTFRNAYTVVPKNVPGRDAFAIAVHYASRDSMAFFLLDQQTGEVRRLTDEIYGWTNWRVSPTGDWIVFRVGMPGEENPEGELKAGLYTLFVPE